LTEEEIANLVHANEIMGQKLEYLEDITQRYFHSPKEKYALANMENGEFMTAQELQREINAMRSLHTQLTKKNRENEIILEEAKTSINIKKFKNERKWLKLYYVSLRSKTKELDALTLGLLQKLIQHIRTDGSNGLIGSAVKSEWSKITEIPKRTFDTHFKVLEDNNIAKFIRNQGIFINPYYARYGNEIEQSTLDLFNLEFDKLDGLREIVKVEQSQ
jgi:hypothetical protein